MRLHFHDYSYFPYEEVLAEREASSLLDPVSVAVSGRAVDVTGARFPERAGRLTYAARFEHRGILEPTQQRLIEDSAGSRGKRQATRYSAHGLHEYKGRFNPQIARALVNILGASQGTRVLDPFCGSGTTLVECAHLGVPATGIDINPLAIFLAKAKLQALSVGGAALRKSLMRVTAGKPLRTPPATDSARHSDGYLARWFTADKLTAFEELRARIIAYGGAGRDVLLAVASNLLREYSLQEPRDLRIRRRDAVPDLPDVTDSFVTAASQFIEKMAAAEEHFDAAEMDIEAFVGDAREESSATLCKRGRKFGCAITSPPYATALPYIDTQRLSLVWLGLAQAGELGELEATLIGSRELRGSKFKANHEALRRNQSSLPDVQWRLCMDMLEALSAKDGFRRKAVPSLVYRYFAEMGQMFGSVRKLMRKRAPFALVVGTNRTVLGGHEFSIDTPGHLAGIAAANGWLVQELLPLQTYQRYGLHAANAVRSESLVILRAM